MGIARVKTVFYDAVFIERDDAARISINAALGLSDEKAAFHSTVIISDDAARISLNAALGLPDEKAAFHSTVILSDDAAVIKPVASYDIAGITAALHGSVVYSDDAADSTVAIDITFGHGHVLNSAARADAAEQTCGILLCEVVTKSVNRMPAAVEGSRIGV